MAEPEPVAGAAHDRGTGPRVMRPARPTQLQVPPRDRARGRHGAGARRLRRRGHGDRRHLRRAARSACRPPRPRSRPPPPRRPPAAPPPAATGTTAGGSTSPSSGATSPSSGATTPASTTPSGGSAPVRHQPRRAAAAPPAAGLAAAGPAPQAGPASIRRSACRTPRPAEPPRYRTATGLDFLVERRPADVGLRIGLVDDLSRRVLDPRPGVVAEVLLARADGRLGGLGGGGVGAVGPAALAVGVLVGREVVGQHRRPREHRQPDDLALLDRQGGHRGEGGRRRQGLLEHRPQERQHVEGGALGDHGVACSWARA